MSVVLPLDHRALDLNEFVWLGYKSFIINDSKKVALTDTMHNGWACIDHGR